jgi:hypothetical protein
MAERALKHMLSPWQRARLLAKTRADAAFGMREGAMIKDAPAVCADQLQNDLLCGRVPRDQISGHWISANSTSQLQF